MALHSLPPLFEMMPEALAARYDAAAPWQLLGEALDELLDELPGERIAIPLSPDFHLLGDRVAIGQGTRILPGAVIEGPVWIGRDVEIRPGAYIRGGCWIGDRTIVGTHTEVKRSVMLPGARAPHQNYVGDSILGVGVNLGAGTILSNFRHDGREIHSRGLDESLLATGRRKLGALLGDGVHTGCNCVLHPGAFVGRRTAIYPGAHLRAGSYPADSVIKLRQSIEVVQRA